MSGSGVLHDSARTLIVRLPDPTGTGSLIRKQLRGPDAAQRAQRERTILRRLAGVDGVPRLAGLPAEENELFLYDEGDTTLASMLTDGPLPVPVLLELGERLAAVLGAVHARGVVHKDVNPSNVMIVAGRPVLIDFELATTAAEERPGFTHQSQITGTLAYLAPEQTGRTGRPVDRRSDLYAFGATLYEMATGVPPFGSGDPLRLLHDHLARLPDPPTMLNPLLPATLGEIIQRLLDKEPDHRYQSAEGCAHDLARAAGGPLTLGERDFPARLVPPSRLVGRDADIATLRRSFAGAVAGETRGVLVSGPSGVGKTVLIDELRPIVTEAGGWFVNGKFDQYRQGPSADAMAQALGGLARLLLAEPDTELERLRVVALPALGSNASLLVTVIPDFRSLLGVEPEATEGEHTEVQARLFQAGLTMLRLVVSPARPLVIVIDDLQWGSATPIAFLELLLRDEDLRGLLVVGAYRAEEVDAAHPLTAVLSRWDRLDRPPTAIRLANLPADDLAALLAEMLRMPVDRASGLATAIADRTGGNPFDTVELINGLRQDGALAPTGDGWRWDAGRVRRWVGDGDVAGLLAARVGRLPRSTRQVLTVLAALGGEIDLRQLGVAAARSGAQLDSDLAPALEDGLVVRHEGPHPAVRFRHDRVQYAAYHRLPERAQRLAHLVLGRRLAAYPALVPLAAQQFLPAVGLIADRADRHTVAELFRSTAAGLKLIDYAMAEQYLSAAVGLAEDADLLAGLRADLHRALYSLGRLADADAVWALIAGQPDPVVLADSASVQIASLTVRGQAEPALALGMDVLRRLGVPVPPREDMRREVDAGLDRIRQWMADARVLDDVRRPDIDDPATLAASQIILRMMPPSFFADQVVMAWLVTAAQRIWARSGPGSALIGSLAHAGVAAILLQDDYETGYRVLRHLDAVGDARGWTGETAVGRFLASVSTAHWYEPVENSIDLAKRANESLVHAGDLAFACFTFHTIVPAQVDCAETLDDYAVELSAAAAFSARVGNEQSLAITGVFDAFVHGLRAGEAGPSEPPDLGGNAMAAAYLHTTRALLGAIFRDDEALIRHAAAATGMMPYIAGNYFCVTTQLMRVLAMAARVRDAAPADRAGPLAELDETHRWFVARAANAPANLRHLAHFVAAVRAAAVDDPAAGPAFDAALREVARRRRPWHHAFIAEQAARHHLVHGMAYIGQRLLQDAYQLYLAWRAPAKVRALEREFPFLHDRTATTATVDLSRSTTLASEAVDLMAVVKATQALSSETSLDNLRVRVTDILGALTGATSVDLLTRGDAPGDWLPPPDTDAARIPLSVVRYAERTREPLLVEDATGDSRFARDPALTGLDVCSVLAVTIVLQGEPRAILVLQNTLWRGAFTRNRLDAVLLIAGQLAVSMENALLYSSLESKVAERTELLRLANDQLEILSRTDPLTGLANRRRLTGWLDQAWRDGGVNGEPVAVAMIDIDHFKVYNDHYGHPAGDACLRVVAGALAGAAGDGWVARYGGEEFAVVLPGADGAAAHAVGERIQHAVAALGERHPTAPGGVVTVSVGVAAEVPQSGRTVDDLIAEADACLYEAKQQGRNRVVSHQTA